jgi:ribosomal protein S18 acetylase RimI-like enzyme
MTGYDFKYLPMAKVNYSTQYATQQDLKTLSQVFLDVLRPIPYYNDLAKENEETKYSYDELSKKLHEDSKSLILIKENGNIVAFCFSRFDDFTIWLEWFGIVKPYRGLKLSGLLLNKLEESARDRNCHKIWCDSRTENKKAISILEKNGYENIALIKNHWYKQDFFLWQKFLIDGNFN